MKSITGFKAALIAIGILVVGGVAGWGVGHTSAPAPAPSHLYLTIATPDMLQTDVGPAVLPSVASVPANSDVTVTIVNFDNPTPLTGQFVKYATATGIEGKFSVEPIDTKNPNGPAISPAQSLASIDPTLVSHTFTIPSLNLNVPLFASSRTTFTFHVGAAGTFEWHCMDPCGTGPEGWSGAMSQQGYMGGALTVV
jgi:hypothetical protein